jgi:esterase/lipase superfamily enzyme
MELLVFGNSGVPVVFFPTRTARFYDYENWKIIEALRGKIEKGLLQVYCVDSIDAESFYSAHSHPGQRISRHIQFEQYIINEVLPMIRRQNPNDYLIAAGCSLGAYHAVNIAFKHPALFRKAVGMSGRYDLTVELDNFRDLFDGYRDEAIYSNMPNQFVPNLTDPRVLEALKKMEIVFAIGKEDPFFGSNRSLSQSLREKKVRHALHVWEEEAHRPRYWRRMVQLYL